MLFPAVCMISSPYVNSNWSWSPETAKLGVDLSDLDLWPLTLTFCMDITSDYGNCSWKFHDDTMMGTWWEMCDRRTDRRTDRQTDRQTYRRTEPVIVRRAGLLWSQQDFEWRWSVPLFKCLTVLEFTFILFDLCLFITFFNFIMNYVPIVTFWIFTYHKIWILSIMFCSIWSYWIIYFLACLEVSWRVVS